MPEPKHFVVALDAATGAEQWRVEDPVETGGVGPVAIADGTALMHLGDPPVLVAVDTTNGRERWRVDLGARPTRAAVVAGVAYVGAGDWLYALNATDGTVRWRVDVDLAGFPAVTDGLVIVTYYGGDDLRFRALRAVQAATGQDVWNFRPPEPITVSGVLAIADGAVFVRGYNYEPNADAVLYALDAATGTERWTASPAYALSEGSVVDGVVYLGIGSNRNENDLLALDAATGAVRWRFATDRNRLGSVVVVDGIVHVVGRGYELSTTLYAIGGSASAADRSAAEPPPRAPTSG
jgi:outer membrane protein assembly factor BamB